MDVLFQPNVGESFSIEVGYFDTVLEMKEKVEKERGIPTSKQTLIFNDNVLNDDLNVHHSEILNGSTIKILDTGDHAAKDQEQKSCSKINLILKMPASNVGAMVEIDSCETIHRLKEKIMQIEGIPVNQLAIHASGVKLHDHKSIQECKLFDKSELEVSVELSPASMNTTLSGSPGNMNNNPSQKMMIYVLTRCCTKKIPMEVGSSDVVRSLKRKLQKMEEESQLELPEEGYFFIYKQSVMDDDRSFRWHRVGQGDTVEIFSGSVSRGS